jgi:tRNA pseudouridine55 synthase
MNNIDDLDNGAVILVDKPLGWSSFDVVNKLRLCLKHATGRKRVKVGHAGTLDPLATGLLIIAFGKSTKLLTGLMGQTKEYVAQIKLGTTTDSYDAETPENAFTPVDHISQENIQLVLAGFKGEQLQRPPVFSAKRFNGKRAYELARKGERPLMPPNLIEIFEIELVDFSPPEVTVRVVCSKGTYIRSLAHDLGQKLGVGAYLSGLRRTRNGDFTIEDAKTTDHWVDKIKDLEKPTA